ncbi:TetR/AcrR family transcriptional regulator [Candidatus Nucleicultrix amoebiphila]|jgi:AcrR family transcriptional regulator|uniref:HTH tetR-type domain-containing protein n=1 Tax=Candidatus Nucleicultrix amoebiphila FS5 TaxID=1414854 RepID=A0A1W6N590_9PROT|nr:TetR/AcrR family transcriptional regulator [Candidatus Nucleicultrix amoebiphila]ARN84971.1 hypothetical protein GQ61_06365 [Candidatus Nucleicultrix amoebiphila FS5]
MLRKIQKLHTKEKIIQTGLQLMAKQGIIATKTLDIAKAAGISHGTIFVHFSTKNDLVVGIIDEVGRRMSEAFQTIKSENASLRTILEAHLTVLEDFEDIFSQILIESPLLPPAVKSTLFMLQSGISHNINQIAKKEMEEGLLQVIPPSFLFNTWNGLIYYYLSHRDLFAPGKSLIRTKGPELIDNFMKLIAKEKEKNNG